MRILSTLAVALPLLLSSITFTLLPTTSAFALPNQTVCIITTYFNNASFDEQVGQRTKCTGNPVQMTGHTSPYKTTEREVLDTPKPPSTGGPGGLPCEFLVSGCSNLPTQRFS